MIFWKSIKPAIYVYNKWGVALIRNIYYLKFVLQQMKHLVFKSWVWQLCVL